MQQAVIIMIALASSVAAADPAVQKAASCSTKGTPIFEIERRDRDSKESSVLKLYASGALSSISTTANGKPGPHSTTCLDKESLDKVTADLKASSWKIEKRSRGHDCVAMASSERSVYSVHGTRVYTMQHCIMVNTVGGLVQTLDAASQKNLDEIERLIDHLLEHQAGGS
jgi:hypothetical protein